MAAGAETPREAAGRVSPQVGPHAASPPLRHPLKRILPFFPVGLAAWLACSGCPSSAPRPAGIGSPAAVQPAPDAVAFQDVAAEVGLDFRLGHGGRSPLTILDLSSGGCGFLDFDRDGHLDVVLAGEEQCRLYRSDGAGKFTDVTEASGLPRQGHWMGIAVGDYDGDGYPDLLLTGFRCLALLRNVQGRRFENTTRTAGLRRDLWTTSAEFADVDRDGRLDLYIAAYVDYRPGSRDFCQHGSLKTACGPEVYAAERGRLYRNTGHGRFEDWTQRSGLAEAAGKTWGVAFADFDRDGWIDLYLGNDRMPCNLFRNRGSGRFEDVGVPSATAFDGMGNLMGAMGVDWGDADGDARLDLFVTTFHQESSALFLSQEGQTFREEAEDAGIAQSSRRYVGFGGGFIDVDNDGDLDLFNVNGHVRDNVHDHDASQSYAQPMQLFLNRGRGSFQDVSGETPGIRGEQLVGRGAAFGDYDRDGRTDILVVNLEGRVRLLRNVTASAAGKGLVLRLAGSRDNPEGLGAQVIATLGDQRRVRSVTRGGSVLSSRDPTVILGMGSATVVGRVEVRWPDGKRTTATALNAGKIHILKHH